MTELAAREEGAGGCLVSCALADAAGADLAFREELARRFDAVEARLAARLARAGMEEGPLPAAPEDLAAAIAAAARGLMLRARAGANAAQLAAISRALVAMAQPDSDPAMRGAP